MTAATDEPLEVWILRPTMGHGGADRVTRTLLQHLDRRRFRLSLVLMKSEGPFLAELPEDVAVHGLRVSRLVHALRPFLKMLRHPPSNRGPDVLFSTSSGANLLAALAHRLSRRSFRLVLSERSTLLRDDRPAWKSRALLSLRRLLYGRADRVAAVSAGVKNELVELVKVPAERVDVVYNPVVTPDLAVQAAEPLEDPWFPPQGEPSIPVVLAAGRLIPVKDFPLLIEAFARLRAGRPARLVILGEGPGRKDLEARVEALGLSDSVRLPGFDANPFRWMARASVFALTSRFEGLPGVLIQAMACGTPVVSTDCPTGPSEVVRDGENGFLVPVGDAIALAERIERLLDSSDLRARFSAQGRTDMRQFHLDSALQRYTETLERAGRR